MKIVIFLFLVHEVIICSDVLIIRYRECTVGNQIHIVFLTRYEGTSLCGKSKGRGIVDSISSGIDLVARFCTSLTEDDHVDVIDKRLHVCVSSLGNP